MILCIWPDEQCRKKCIKIAYITENKAEKVKNYVEIYGQCFFSLPSKRNKKNNQQRGKKGTKVLMAYSIQRFLFAYSHETKV